VSPRLVGLDLARWCALLGMMATHLLATRDELTGDPTWVAEVFSGRASALFAVLAGVSLALVTGGALPLRGAERVARSAGLAVRAIAVGVVGLLLGEVDSGLAVILVNYALLFLVGLLVVGWGARSLAVLAVALALLAPVLLWWVRPVLPPRGYESPSLASLEAPGHLLSELVVTGYYPVLVWSAYVVAGMALGRLDLRAVPSRVLALVGAVAAAVAVLAELVSDRLLARPGMVRVLDRDQWRLAGRDDERALDALRHVIDAGMYGQTPIDGAWQWMLVAAPHSSTPTDLLRTGGSAVAAVVACLLLLRALGPRGNRVVAVLAGAGAATLSLYTLHVLMTSDLLPPADDDRGAVLQVLVVVGAGSALALVGRRGPLEAVVALGARTTERAVLGPARKGG
jgi:hypothetical protein